MIALLKRLTTEENGQGLVEYGLIILLIALAVTAAMTGLAGKITGLFGKIGNKLE